MTLVEASSLPMGRVVSREQGPSAGRRKRFGGSDRRRSDERRPDTDVLIDEPPEIKMTPNDFHSYPGVASSMLVILVSLRWGAVVVGVAFAALSADVELQIVASVAVAIFLTTMRTMFPLKLGDPTARSIGFAMLDVAALAAAIGLSDGFANPFVGCLFIAVAVVAFGWGLPIGSLAVLTAAIVTNAVYYFSGDQFVAPSALAIMTLIGSAIVPAAALERLMEWEGRRRLLFDEADNLTQANELLGALNDLAKVLPSSLDHANLVTTARSELAETFDASRLALLAWEDGDYSTLVQEGFALSPEVAEAELPDVLGRASRSPEPLLIEDLSKVSDRDGSGLYIRLIVRNNDTGLVAIEHNEPGFYTERDRELLTGMADMLALSLANARSFNQLRSLAADEERTKLARDLHDRLGQYLTYIAIELERINSEAPSTAIKELHEDVQGLIGEFRDTLLELREAVSIDRPLSAVLIEVVERFAKRNDVEVDLDLPNHDQRLPSRVENEFLRIAQEALTNIQKHANASQVTIRWSVDEGAGRLVIEDDGRGFTPGHGIRGTAYGLVGMRERAASVSATLNISSEPGQGTVITVQSTEDRAG